MTNLRVRSNVLGGFLPRKVCFIFFLVKTFHTDVNYSLLFIMTTQALKKFKYLTVSIKLRRKSKREWMLSSESLKDGMFIKGCISMKIFVVKVCVKK